MAQNDPELTGKVAFVTGGGSGIGRATALAFARSGASVAVVDRDEDGAAETAREITASGGAVLVVRCDVTDTSDVDAAVAATLSRFGRLDAAFNNAGIDQPGGPAHEVSTEDFDRLVAVNLRGVFLCLQAEARVMLAQGGGTIVNTASGAGVTGIRGQAAYCATKFGVIGLTKGAALDYADAGIRINAVCPGFIRTPMMQRFTGGTEAGIAEVVALEPIGRVGEPEEIASAVLWLSSDASSFVVGHALVVDGGQTV
jgi:NAD(P)-dependent dehydrogenase (short-subunit alcohol dehydrogenase family)